MRVQMSYKILVSVLILITGDDQLLDGSLVSQTPTFQIDSTSQRPFYSCKFKAHVDCLWKIDGTTISLSLNDYTYVTGNGYTTRDCSIIGKSQGTHKLNRYKNEAKVTCSGFLLYRTKKFVQIGDSIQLNCSFSQRRNCSWRRDDQVIAIDGRYKYIQQYDNSNVHDCSIEIEKIQPIDLTTWMCLVTATDDEGQHNLTNVYYSLQLNISADPTDTESTAYADSSTTKRSTGLLTSPDKTSLLTTMDPPTASNGLMPSPPIQFFLGFIGILLLIAITIGLVQLIRKLVKKKNKQHNNKSGDHDEENRDRLPLETTVPLSSSSSPSDQPHSYYNVTTITTQSQAEDANGYLVPLKITSKANSNKNKVKISKRNKNVKDPKNHIYEKVENRARNEHQ